MTRGTSGYKRVASEAYMTPAWCVRDLIYAWGNMPWHIWEPACGTGNIAEALRESGRAVMASDLVDRGYTGGRARVDFLLETKAPHFPTRLGSAPMALVTNPPWNLAERFLDHAMGLQVPSIALLLPYDWSARPTRAHLFNWEERRPLAPSGKYHAAAKLVLRQRPLWFEPPPGKSRQPTGICAWYLWHFGPGTVMTECFAGDPSRDIDRTAAGGPAPEGD
jgi:hypothetical protein